MPAWPEVGEMVSDVPLAATDLTIQAVGRRSTTRMRAATIIWTLRVRMVDEIVEIMKRLRSLTGPPGPQNILRRVFVAVEDQPTGRTDVSAYRQAFGHPLHTAAPI